MINFTDMISYYKMKRYKSVILLILFYSFLTTLFAIEYEWYTQSFPWVGEEGENPEVVFADLIEQDKLEMVLFELEPIFWYDPCDGWHNAIGKIRNDCEYKIKVRKDAIPKRIFKKIEIQPYRDPTVIIVDINGTGDYTTIQEGIDASSNGDTVSVYPGTYYENINYNGKNITVASLYITTQNNSYIDSTIIDGNQNGSVVTFESGEDSTAVLSGFTIKNGSGMPYGSSSRGGGILCYDSNPKVKNCIIIENRAGSGGGICCKSSIIDLSDVIIKNNHVQYNGGGIYFWNNASANFDAENRCSIFLNYASTGCELRAINCNTIDIVVDTFTIMEPKDYFVYPLENFTFDILNCKVEPVNQDLYVSPYGNDNNSGITANEALKTISYALVKIIPDSSDPHTIHLANGTYSPSQTEEIFPLYCRSFVSLQGTDVNSTILDGEELSGILYCRNDNDFSIENLTIKNGNSPKGAGICLSSSSPSLTNLIINNNTATDLGAGVYCSGSNPSLKNLIIIGNTAIDGAGIYCLGSNPIINNITINNNTAEDSGGGLCSGCESCPTLENCILWNNTPQEIYLDIQGSITVTYSDIQDGTGQPWFGEGCIDIAPLFVNPSFGDYSLSQNSPCINAGNPDPQYNDPDGTRADMGAFTATLETYRFDSNRINWVSLPILHPDKTDAYDFFEPLIQNGSLRRVLYGDYKLYEDETGVWVNEIGDLRTVDGYKVEMFEPDFISLYGYKVPPDTTIYLYAKVDKAPWPPPLGDGNWIGYFIPGSQLWQVAFSEILGKITFIKADDWAYIRNYTVNLPYTVDYGKLYIVGVSEDCSFIWQGFGQSPAEPYKKQQTEVFSYEEDLDYMPIFVDSTEALNDIDEIGVFLDDECIGASVVEGFPVFIPAYIEDDDSTGNKDFNELSFQVATYGKGGKRSIPAFVYNETQDAFVQKPVILDKDSYAVVRLGTGEGIELPKEFTLYQNFPNPITSSTTISFIPSPGVEKSEIKIYNIRGQLVKEFKNQNAKGKMNIVEWDGKDNNGKQLSSGIYFYKLISGEKTAVKKMVLMR